MFTGIIAGTGTLTDVVRLGRDRRLCVAPKVMLPAFAELTLGESIAVNGACLSVERFTSSSFWLYASEETLSRTTLGTLSSGSTVNLERALRLGDRLGGHIVSGHVDCIGTVVSITAKGQSQGLTVRYPESVSSQVVEKGSVALDGVSLTINACTHCELSVNIIPETQKNTTVPLWGVGTRLNIETDILGKYVERMLGAATNRSQETTKTSSRLDSDFLLRHGYL